MGLIKAGMGAVGGTLADQWKEFFYCVQNVETSLTKTTDSNSRERRECYVWTTIRKRGA